MSDGYIAAEDDGYTRADDLVDDVDGWTVRVNIEGCIRYETTEGPQHVIEIRRMVNRRLDGRPARFWTSDLYREDSGGGHVFVADGGRGPELAPLLADVPDLFDRVDR